MLLSSLSSRESTYVGGKYGAPSLAALIQGSAAQPLSLGNGTRHALSKDVFDDKGKVDMTIGRAQVSCRSHRETSFQSEPSVHWSSLPTSRRRHSQVKPSQRCFCLSVNESFDGYHVLRSLYLQSPHPLSFCCRAARHLAPRIMMSTTPRMQSRSRAAKPENVPP